MKKQIVIIIEGGIVQDVRGIPEDTEVIIADFDTEGADPDDVQQCPWPEIEEHHGKTCFIGVWGGSAPSNPLPQINWWERPIRCAGRKMIVEGGAS